MPLATYKDLCIDANDAEASARFWGLQLDLAPSPHRDGVWRLDDATGVPQVWINPVPEPVTVKNRVHLDLNAESFRTALDAGAVVVAERERWTTMRDPDGQEFCVFVRPEPVTQRIYELIWDTGNSAEASHAIAAWWATTLGARPVDDERGFSWIEDIPGAPFESIDFGPVPEPKTVKNRVHIDVMTDDVEALIGHGATVVRGPGDGIDFHVLADPDGNEFCAFVRS